MKRSILTEMTLMTFVLVFALNTTAASVEEAAKEAAMIERVRWSGLSLGGYSAVGLWLPQSPAYLVLLPHTSA